MLAKQNRGCRFFITQSVYDAASTTFPETFLRLFSGEKLGKLIIEV